MKKNTGPRKVAKYAAKRESDRTKKIAIIVGMTNTYGRDVLHGIGRYAKIYGPWNLHLDYEFSRWELPPWLTKWRGDGIISRIACEAIRDFAQKTGIPVVDLNERTTELELPYVFIHQAAVGLLAAEHLLERGFRHFAYIDQRGLLWSDGRCESFRRTVLELGHSFSEFAGSPFKDFQRDTDFVYRNSAWESETEKIVRWLQDLPKPVGIMACNSFRGLQLLEICRRAGIAVPEEAAVVAGDNEETVCEIASPTMTAIQLDGEAVGFQASKLLDRAMQGEVIDEESLLIPPKGIIVRNSTMITAINDGTLGKALEYIRENARFNISPEDVAEKVGVSLRKLQLTFKRSLNSTLHERVVSFKLETVAMLLRESDLSLEEVAYRSGYNYIQQMSDAFLERFGVRPGTYRKTHQPSSENDKT